MRPIVPLALLMLAACQPAAIETAPAAAPQQAAAQAAATEAHIPVLVSTNCASCHAVRRGELSPLAAAPSFVHIANQPGLSRATLTAFLADAHNYPDQMDVELDAEDVEEIAAYLLTLQQEDYRPGPS